MLVKLFLHRVMHIEDRVPALNLSIYSSHLVVGSLFLDQNNNEA